VIEFDTHTLVLLRRGPRALEFSDAELEQLQAQHLAHLDALRERGVLDVMTWLTKKGELAFPRAGRQLPFP
jgi:hypothetical protein